MSFSKPVEVALESSRRRRRRLSVMLDLELLEKRLFLSRLTGNDVSQFQLSMNWTTNYNTGNRFALIRASRSDTLPDIDVSVNVPGAKAAGLVVGVYHRALPFSNVNDNGAFRDPIVDADSFITSGGAWMGAGYIRPILDIENGKSLRDTPVNGYNLSSWVVAWVNRIKTVKNVTPLVYCNTDMAANYLNSSVVAVAPDIWIANWEEVNYGNPVTGSGNPPQGVWGSGSNWDFWQYGGGEGGWGPTYGASSPEIDRDVFNGSDINVLKQNYVTGAAQIPFSPSPAIDATNVTTTNLLLNWADSANATKYDVYLDNMVTPIATNISVSQYNVASLTSGAHSWKITAKGTTADDDTWTTTVAAWTFSAVTNPPPSTPVNLSPGNGTTVTIRPVTFDWQDSTNATSYDIYINNNDTTLGASNLSSSTFTGLPGSFPQTYNWYVVARNDATLQTATGPTWTVTVDNGGPTASLGSQAPLTGQATFDFNVTYVDSTSGVDVSTLDSSDITVTAPNGYSANATFITVDNNTNGSPRVATYRIPAPGGFWNDADNNVTYTVSMNSTEVKDTVGNSRAAGAIGSGYNFSTLGTAWLSGSVLNVAFDGTVTPVLLSTSGSNIAVTKNASTTNFSGVSSISVIGSSADDRLQINAPLTPPLSFDNSTGNDLLEITGGAYTFASDIATPSRNLGIFVASGASALFSATQHLRSLSVDGTATLSTGGAKYLWLKDLAVAGQLNLTDNDLILDYTGSSPVGAWNNGAYTGVTGMVVNGRAGGTWAGSGIVTDQPDAIGVYSKTTLAISEASEAFAIADPATALFDTETVDASTVIVKYTFAGDLSLSGHLDGDDYFRMDTAFVTPGSPAYCRGDLDLNGRRDIDDYFLIDSTYSKQGSTYL